MLIYVTFGQGHAHHVNNQTFDHNCIASIDCKNHTEAREIAFGCFGPKFCTSHDPLEMTHTELEKMLSYYPRGVIPLNY